MLVGGIDLIFGSPIVPPSPTPDYRTLPLPPTKSAPAKTVSSLPIDRQACAGHDVNGKGRQLVATALGSGYSVEAPLMGEEQIRRYGDGVRSDFFVGRLCCGGTGVIRGSNRGPADHTRETVRYPDVTHRRSGMYSHGFHGSSYRLGSEGLMHEKSGIVLELQRLVFKPHREEFRDYEYLEDLGVGEGSVLYCVLNLYVSAEGLKPRRVGIAVGGHIDRVVKRDGYPQTM